MRWSLGVMLSLLGCSPAPATKSTPATEPPRPLVLWGPGGDISAPAPGYPTAKRGVLCPALIVDGAGRLLISNSSTRYFEENLGDRVLAGHSFTGELTMDGKITQAAAYGDLGLTKAASGSRASGLFVFGEATKSGAKLGGHPVPNGAFLAHIDERGEARWVQSSEYVSDLTVDDEGSVITLKDSDWPVPDDVPEFPPSTLNKYSARGALLWRRDVQGTIRSNVVAHDEFIYFAYSACQERRCSSDIQLAKYTSYGFKVWQREILTSVTGGTDHIILGADHSGDLYFAANFVEEVRLGSTLMLGPAFTSLSIGDAFLAKINSHGDIAFVRHIRGNAMSVKQLVVDTKGRPWITGVASPSPLFTLFPLRPPPLPRDYGEREPFTHFVARFDREGHLLTAFEVARGRPISMAADRSGDIFLTSSYTGGLALHGATGARSYEYGKFGCAVLRIPLDYDPRIFEASR